MSISHVLKEVAEFNPPAAISASLCSKAASVTKEMMKGHSVRKSSKLSQSVQFSHFGIFHQHLSN